MKLSNQEENEINNCKFQIQWRETEIKSQRQKFENTKWKLEFETDDYNNFWKTADKMTKLEIDIEHYKKRLAELNEKSKL